MATTRSRFVGNTIALGVSLLLVTGLTLAQMKILAAHLSLAIFGLFAALRGLALLVSILAANGFPQLLVRFLPEHAAHHSRARALRLSGTSLVVTLVLCGLLLAVLALLPRVVFRQVPASEPPGPLFAWFAVTTVAVALKLVVYGGFNGLRRFGSQTVFETLSLAWQVAWMAVDAESLTLTRLFQIVGVTSSAAVLAALPWYLHAVTRDIAPSHDKSSAGESYANYWGGALGLSLVALAFTDADRWVLSGVLALEALSLFHVASRIARLANRFIAIPVLAFQPEATRLRAQGRDDALDLSLRTFFKTNVLLGVLAAVAIPVYADPLIRLVSSDQFLGARATLCLLAITAPVTAMTASLTAVMKALDGVRSALYCDLAWACVYVAGLFTLTRPLGVEGAGVAQLAACVVQLLLAFRLATLRPRVAIALGVLVRALVSGVVAFAPVVIAAALRAPVTVLLALAPVALLAYFRVSRVLGVFAGDERERLQQMVSGRRISSLVEWVA